MRRLALVFLVAAGLARTAEYAVLTSGARLRVDRHEADGAKVRLYHAGGMVELEAIRVTAFEPVEEPAPALPASSPQVPSDAPAQAAKALTPIELADAAADRYGLPHALVRSVMAAESGLRADAVSAKGALGLMQLMPDTALALGADPRDPAQNVDAGTRYLRDLLERYDGRLWHALAAYNAGPGAVEKYRGIPPYSETVLYINTVERKMARPPTLP